MIKRKMICAQCKGDDVVVDAWANWDVASQDWVLRTAFDEAFCLSCEEACDVEEPELSPEEAKLYEEPEPCDAEEEAIRAAVIKIKADYASSMDKSKPMEWPDEPITKDSVLWEIPAGKNHKDD